MPARILTTVESHLGLWHPYQPKKHRWKHRCVLPQKLPCITRTSQFCDGPGQLASFTKKNSIEKRRVANRPSREGLRETKIWQIYDRSRKVLDPTHPKLYSSFGCVRLDGNGALFQATNQSLASNLKTITNVVEILSKILKYMHNIIFSGRYLRFPAIIVFGKIEDGRIKMSTKNHIFHMKCQRKFVKFVKITNVLKKNWRF